MPGPLVLGPAGRAPVGGRREVELARVEPPRLLAVLAHVAGPVGDDAPRRVAVPGVALSPRRPGKARLQRAVAGGLDLGSDLDRTCAAIPHRLQGLADVGRLQLEVEDDRAA